MKKNLTFQRSDRTFKIWEYQISHGQVLIRSPKAPATSTSPEFLTNVDVICLDVEYMAIPRILNGLELLEPTWEEIQNIEGLLDRKIDSEKIKILVSSRKRFPLVAFSLSFSENDWDIFESPIEFQVAISGRILSESLGVVAMAKRKTQWDDSVALLSHCT